MENIIPVYEGVVDVLKEMNRAQIDVMSAIAVTGDRAARAAEEEIVPAYKDVIETLKELNRTTIDHKSNIDVLADSYKQIEEKTSEAVRAIRPFSDAIGQMATDASEGMEMLKNATTSAIATMLEALAKESFGRAAVAAGIGMLPGGQLNIPGAIALAAAGTALMVSAGFVRGLKEGGIVTKPTQALIGEAGPEAVIPLNKAGGMMGVTINQYIRGSVLSERQLQRFAVGGLAKMGRRY